MSELDAVKARAAEPDKVLEWVGNPYMDEYIDALQESQADVPKLVALIEKIRDDAAQRANGYEATADRLCRQVIDRDPERDPEEAQRYGAYATAYRAVANIIGRTIKEGLTE